LTVQRKIYGHRWDDGELSHVRSVWKVLVESFFQPIVGTDKTVLDIGCGFCHFLNAVQAREKWGVDANEAVAAFAGPDVRLVISDDLRLLDLPDGYFDCIFVSNFLEHLDSSAAVIALLERIRALLKPGGIVIILQPNFRLLGASYFDFIDHKTVLTEKSVREALEIAGLDLQKEITRFLPYTTKSRFPQHPALVRVYLAMRPLWYLLGKQSLFVAESRAKPLAEGVSPR
jgi:SAM-dependent methyltransferase